MAHKISLLKTCLVWFCRATLIFLAILLFFAAGSRKGLVCAGEAPITGFRKTHPIEIACGGREKMKRLCLVVLLIGLILGLRATCASGFECGYSPGKGLPGESTIRVYAFEKEIALFWKKKKPDPEKKVSKDREDAKKFKEKQEYLKSIEIYQRLLKDYPESKQADAILFDLGGCLDSLARDEFSRLFQEQKGLREPHLSARDEFLHCYGHLNCWIYDPDEGTIRYDNSAFEELLKRFPQSPLTDQAAYRLMPRFKEYEGLPDPVLKECEYLEGMLNKYPKSNLRPQILEDLGRRYRILYEIYSFSPQNSMRDPEAGRQFLEKASKTYDEILKKHKKSPQAKKARETLKEMGAGKRIYIMQTE